MGQCGSVAFRPTPSPYPTSHIGSPPRSALPGNSWIAVCPARIYIVCDRPDGRIDQFLYFGYKPLSAEHCESTDLYFRKDFVKPQRADKHCPSQRQDIINKRYLFRLKRLRSTLRLS